MGARLSTDQRGENWAIIENIREGRGAPGERLPLNFDVKEVQDVDEWYRLP